MLGLQGQCQGQSEALACQGQKVVEVDNVTSSQWQVSLHILTSGISLYFKDKRYIGDIFLPGKYTVWYNYSVVQTNVCFKCLFEKYMNPITSKVYL